MQHLTEKNIFFITGLPKSGTTWLVNMLNSIEEVMVRGEGCFFSDIYRTTPSLYGSMSRALRPWYEYISHRKHNWLDMDDHIETVNRYNYIRVETLGRRFESVVRECTRTMTLELMREAAGSEDRIVRMGDKTPVMFPDELRRIRETFPGSRIVCLKRNVKDYIVSHVFHYWRSVRNRRPDSDFRHLTVDDFLQTEGYVRGDTEELVRDETAQRLASLWKSVYDEAEALAAADPELVRVVSYEELKEDPDGTFSEVLDFLGIDKDETSIGEIVESTSISSVKRSGSRVEKEHIRNGRPGDWKNHLGTGVNEKIEMVVNG